jgi:acetyl-CoA synthetase
MFETTPTYPHAGRYWETVEKHKITQFYTAPTAIRALMGLGKEHVEKYDLSSLKILGCVGEPLNPEAWRWYHDVVGKGKCTVVDTYWQTESGGHLLTPIPTAVPTIPGSVSKPFFGILPVLLDAESGKILENSAEMKSSDHHDGLPEGATMGVLAISKPWPGIGRTIFGDHQRYLDTYMKPYKGYYFTGDRAYRNKDGYYFISGRVDDVINVAGHRLGTAEVESALVLHNSVSEAAVIAIPHEIKGQCIWAFVILNVNDQERIEKGHLSEKEVMIDLKFQVRKVIGAFATPEAVVLVPNLPKTRSGKIMRRILRKISCNELSQLGDISTLADPAVVQLIISKVEKLLLLQPHQQQ